MRKFILAVILTFFSFAWLPGSAMCSGSDTVFVRLKADEFILKNALEELPPNEQVLEFLACFTKPVYLVRVSASQYDEVEANTSAGIEVVVAFENYETISFSYYPLLDSIVGRNSKEEFVILLK